MWTDVNSRSYLSLTLHFAQDRIFHQFVVAVNHYIRDTKSAKNIRGVIAKFLKNERLH